MEEEEKIVPPAPFVLRLDSDLDDDPEDHPTSMSDDDDVYEIPAPPLRAYSLDSSDDENDGMAGGDEDAHKTPPSLRGGVFSLDSDMDEEEAEDEAEEAEYGLQYWLGEDDHEG